MQPNTEARLLSPVEHDRLLRIAELAKLAVGHSTGFHSAWEFDRHDPACDAEAWHRELIVLTGLYAECVRCQKLVPAASLVKHPRYGPETTVKVCPACAAEYAAGAVGSG